jgi:hypothetical protein
MSRWTGRNTDGVIAVVIGVIPLSLAHERIVVSCPQLPLVVLAAIYLAVLAAIYISFTFGKE